MANTVIRTTELTQTTALSNTDLFVVVRGVGSYPTTNSVSFSTLKASTKNNIRDAGAVNAVTIDFSVDETVIYAPTDVNAITLSGFTAGKLVTVYAKCSTASVITTGGNANVCSLGVATITPVVNSVVKTQYLCTGTTLASVYVTYTR